MSNRPVSAGVRCPVAPVANEVAVTVKDQHRHVSSVEAVGVVVAVNRHRCGLVDENAVGNFKMKRARFIARLEGFRLRPFASVDFCHGYSLHWHPPMPQKRMLSLSEVT